MAVSGLLTELEDTTNDMDICAVQLSEVGSGQLLTWTQLAETISLVFWKIKLCP